MKAETSPVAQRLRELIRPHGRIPFCRFMQEALHGLDGYYTRAGIRIGREGDFVTGPEISPALGASVGGLLCGLAEQLGQPVQALRVTELGPGRGLLMEPLLRELTRRGRSLPEVLLVEQGSEQLRECTERLKGLQVEPATAVGLAQTESLAAADGLMIANEFFDALPVHRVRGAEAGGIEEAWVVTQGEGFAEVWGAPSSELPAVHLARLGVRLAPGVEAEVNLLALQALRQAARLLGRGLFVILDYGYPSHLLYDPEIARPTLRAFRKGMLRDNPLEAVGEQDITAHVDFTALTLTAAELGLDLLRFADQSGFLVGLGVHELPESARRGLVRLINAEEMGGTIKVLALGRGLDDTLFAQVRDRRRQLQL